MTTWNPTQLFGYTSPNDPQIDADIEAMAEACNQFATQHSDTNLNDPQQLLTALTDYEQLLVLLDQATPLRYLRSLNHLDTRDPSIQARLNQFATPVAQMHNQVLFFPLKLGKIQNQANLLADPNSARFHYFLQQQFNADKQAASILI